MRRIFMLLTSAVVIWLVLSAPFAQADWLPVSLPVSLSGDPYMSADVSVIVRAGSNMNSDTKTDTAADLMAEANVYDNNWPDVPWQYAYAEAVSAKQSPYDGLAELQSALSYWGTGGYGPRSFYASMSQSDTFDITLGSSAEVPFGTPLVLQFTASPTSSGTEWAAVPQWSLIYGANFTLDDDHLSGTLMVTAGQTLTGFSFSHSGETIECATIDGGPGSAVDVVMELGAVPEPSTLMLLAMGAAGAAWLAWRRRRRSSRVRTSCGRCTCDTQAGKPHADNRTILQRNAG